MTKGSRSKKDKTNIDKMKNEMRKKREKAEVFSEMEVRTGSLEKNGQSQISNREDPEVMPNAEKGVFDQEKNEISNHVAADKVDLVVFRVGMEQFAFMLKHVKEIVKVAEIKKVPYAPAHVVGLSNLRGVILPVLDIRKCLNMPQKEVDDDSRIIVTDIQGRQAGIIVDRISQVTSVEAPSIVEPPANIKNTQGGYVSGITVKDKGKSIIMVLDVEKIVDIRQLERVFAKSQVSGKDDFGSLRSHIEDKEKLVIFNIGDENYSLNIKNVKEILRYGELLNVPNSKYYVEGVMSVRNSLLTVINPGKILGVECNRICESTRIVVVDAGAFSYGIVVDKVSEVANVPKQSFYRPLKIAKNSEMELVSRFFNLNDGKKIIMVLEPHKMASLMMKNME
jgi:purine-binding chemotaxis protein CheW